MAKSRKELKQKSQMPVPARNEFRSAIIGVIIVLIIATAAVYVRVATHDFIQLDDLEYVRDNPHIQGGLTPQNMQWAFIVKGYSANWHPLTWMSHMADIQAYTLLSHTPMVRKLLPTASGYDHLVSMLIHILCSVLLFLVLLRMTGSVWRSAFVAAAFAWHPLHVESVAWAAERKDVLSTLFWLLTMYAYVFYVEKPGVGRYVLVAAALALGLLSKPMLVTLPFVLLLLDYWPLKRVDPKNKQGTTWPRLLVEKLPLVGLAVVSSIITFTVQHQTGAVGSIESLPIAYRIGNAILAYVTYIWKMILPINLGVFYPHPALLLDQWWMQVRVVGAALLLAGVTALAIMNARKRGYVLAGWLWYVGTLVPVIGIVQVGSQGSADRYTYVPLIGLFIIVAWLVPDLLANLVPVRNQIGKSKAVTGDPGVQAYAVILGAASAVILMSWLVLTFIQVGYWENSETVFRHAIKSVRGSHLAYADLGVELECQYRTNRDRAKLDEAIDCYEKSLAINASQPGTQSNLGHALMSRGDYDGATQHLLLALQYKKGAPFPQAHFNLGTVYNARKMYAEAIQEYQTAADEYPEDQRMPALQALSDVYAKSGRIDESIEALRQVVNLNPGSAESHNQLGMALGEHGRSSEAITEFEEAVRLDPNYRAAHYNIGYAYAQQGKYRKAMPYLEKALQLDDNFPQALYQMAVALYATGDYAGSWNYVHRCQALGAAAEPQFLANLRSKMPEPGR